MKGDGDLDQSLQELAIRFGSPAPDAFENLVGFEELAVIQQGDPALVSRRTGIKRYQLAILPAACFI